MKIFCNSVIIKKSRQVLDFMELMKLSKISGKTKDPKYSGIEV